jgi:multimeric flavodoxin WrbA
LALGGEIMKIFGISGSPRLQGTHYAVNYALDYLKEKGCEIKYFSVARKEIKFCMHCDYCIRKKEGCIHKDDMNEVYENLIWADGIIMGTPIYQGNITGQLKTVMDRCRAIVAKNPKVLNGKIGMGIAVGGDRNGGQEIALRTIHDFYIINEMIPVGGGSFGANLGATFWSKDKGKDGIMKDDEGLRVLRKTLNKFLNILSKR